MRRARNLVALLSSVLLGLALLAAAHPSMGNAPGAGTHPVLTAQSRTNTVVPLLGKRWFRTALAGVAAFRDAGQLGCRARTRARPGAGPRWFPPFRAGSPEPVATRPAPTHPERRSLFR
jgi:hypothetical protein